jgi:hypothetical protein
MFQRQASLAAFSDDGEDSFGVPHHEYLSVLLNLNSLPSFAMFSVLLRSDYYDGSVIIDLSVLRQSHVPLAIYVSSVP